MPQSVPLIFWALVFSSVFATKTINNNSKIPILKTDQHCNQQKDYKEYKVN